ncbi:NAD-dependent epimerase/dehydratase family protein [Bilophila wadsworthia]|uniref:NAD-dependent epimerase/dehydratase family protein n=1 Tax=Bilophila wadsworthia TaxID=35833 RepID=UPI00351F9F91
MRILVTGGAGFIGSHLVRALLRQGDEVVVFDRVPVPHLLQDIMDSITYVQGDSSSDLDLYRAVATNGIEGIFHLGALMAGVCEQNPPLAFQVNFRSTQVLLDAAVACGVKRFFFMSSISLYSPTSVEPVPEDAPKDPATIYGQTKLAGEHLLRWYVDNHGIDSRGIRPTWVWGPNRTNGLTTQYTTGLVDSIARGGEVHVDNPDERGDWIYIHDTIKAMLLVWNAEKPAQRFYTVCGSVHTASGSRGTDQPPLPGNQSHLCGTQREHLAVCVLVRRFRYPEGTGLRARLVHRGLRKGLYPRGHGKRLAIGMLYRRGGEGLLKKRLSPASTSFLPKAFERNLYGRIAWCL